ncbi:MFS transporter [Nocardia sp. CWNU-33]|uniref:MFS transporter n=1 Tax=Nocardia sp. CWNU-33 TaxID=3392117 RepID=UPI00398E4DC1
MQQPEPRMPVDRRVRLTPGRGISTFGALLVGAMTGNLMPLMIIAMGEDLGFREDAAGGVMTACLLACALTCLATTRWAEPRSRYLLGRVSMIAMAAGFGIAAFVPSTPVAVVGIIVGGMASGGAVAVGGAALAALRNSNRVSGLSGLVNRVVITAVLALIPILGTHMTNAFGIVAALALAVAFTTTWLPASLIDHETNLREDATKTVLPEGISRTSLTIAGFTLLTCFAVWAISEDSMWTVAGVMGADTANLSEHQMGLALSLSTAGGILAALALALIGSHFGRTIPIAILLLLGGALKLGTCMATGPTMFVVLIVAWNTVYAVVFMYIVAIASALDPSGRWSAPILGTYMVGSAFAPLFGTLISQTLGYHVLGLILGGISVALVSPIVAIARLASRTERESAPHQGESDASFNEAAIV